MKGSIISSFFRLVSALWLVGLLSETETAEDYVNKLLDAAAVGKVAKSVQLSEFLGSDFEKTCLSQPDKLTELHKLLCKDLTQIQSAALEDLATLNKISEKSLKRGSSTFGWGPNRLQGFGDVEKVKSLFTPIVADSTSLIKKISPETIIPDIVKMGRSIDITSGGCYGRKLDISGFPFRNTCRRILRTRVLRIPYRIDFAPPVLYRLPMVKMEASRSLLHSKTFPGWLLKPEANIKFLPGAGDTVSNGIQHYRDFLLGMAVATRSTVDLQKFPLEMMKSQASNPDELDHILAAQKDLEQHLALSTIAQGALNTLGAGSFVLQNVTGLLQLYRESLEKNYGELSPASEPIYMMANSISSTSSVGVVSAALGSPFTVEILNKLVPELGVLNEIPYLSLNGVGVIMSIINGGGFADLMRVKAAMQRLSEAMSAAEYARMATEISQIISRGDLSLESVSELIFDALEKYSRYCFRAFGGVHCWGQGKSISEQFKLDLGSLKNSLHGIKNTINDLTSGLGGLGVGFRIHRTDARFCHQTKLPSDYFEGQPTSKRPGGILSFIDKKNPWLTIQRLSVSAYSSGYLDAAVLGELTDYLKVFKPKGKSLPIGGLLARMSPEFLEASSELFELPEFSKKFLIFSRHDNSFYKRWNPEECSKLAKLSQEGKIAADINSLRCAFGSPTFINTFSRHVPFLSESSRLDIIQTLAESYILAPQFWENRSSYKARINKIDPSIQANTGKNYAPFLETDMIQSTNSRAPVFPGNCVKPSDFVSKDYDEIVDKANGEVRTGLDSPLVRSPLENPDLYYLWTTNKCCLYGGGVYYD